MRRIEFNNDAYQSCVHTIDGIEIKIVLAWNDTARIWALELYDNVSGELLLGGGAITSGVNLFKIVPPYTLFCIYLSSTGFVVDPKRNNLSSGYLYIGTQDEL